MALASVLTCLVALSVPVWLVVEQLHAWRGSRAHLATPQPVAATPAHLRTVPGDLGRTAA